MEIINNLRECVSDAHMSIDEIDGFLSDYENIINDSNIHFSAGISRVAIIDKLNKRVYKFDYGFCGVCGSCETEYNLYHDIISRDKTLIDFFAPIDKINENVYVMPYIEDVGNARYGTIDYYLTEEEYKHIRQYVKDMHRGNFGFIDGKPVLIDYAFNSLTMGFDTEDN